MSSLMMSESTPASFKVLPNGYLPWIRSIAWSERIFGVEAREAREARGERRGSRSSAAVAVLRCVPVAWAHGELSCLGVIGWCP